MLQTDALSPLMKSRSVSRRTKLRIYHFVIWPTVLYASETWTLTTQRETRMEVFENNILRRILGPVYDEEEGNWRRRHNWAIRDVTGHVKCGEGDRDWLVSVCVCVCVCVCDGFRQTTKKRDRRCSARQTTTRDTQVQMDGRCQEGCGTSSTTRRMEGSG